MSDDSLADTVVGEDAGPVRGQPDISRVVLHSPVEFAAGQRPRYSEELADILRSRLLVAATVILVILGAAFAATLVTGVWTLWRFRGLVLMLLATAAGVLWRARDLSLRQLRGLELLVFGSVVVQLSLTMVGRLAELAALSN